MNTADNGIRFVFVGESLIDFTATHDALAFQGHPGGALTNAAIACARLGQPTAFVSQLSTDLFGERLLAHLQCNGVDTRFVLRSPAPSSLAFVERSGAINRYAFYVQGTADTLWSPERLPQLPGTCAWLHFGSIALLHEPAASRILDFVHAERGRRVVVLDPNARPSLIADVTRWRSQCREWVGQCDLLKLSDEDLAVLMPESGADLDRAARQLLGLGPPAVVLTRGAQGATLYRAATSALSVPAPVVQVSDTIGAGDTFAAALSVALSESGVQARASLEALADEAWRDALRFAVVTAALSCTRPGADPPSRAEVDSMLSQPEP